MPVPALPAAGAATPPVAAIPIEASAAPSSASPPSPAGGEGGRGGGATPPVAAIPIEASAAPSSASPPSPAGEERGRGGEATPPVAAISIEASAALSARAQSPLPPVSTPATAAAAATVPTGANANEPDAGAPSVAAGAPESDDEAGGFGDDISDEETGFGMAAAAATTPANANEPDAGAPSPPAAVNEADADPALLTGAGLGLDASYSDSGGAKVELAIAKLKEEEKLSASALVKLNETKQLPEELLILAKDQVLRAMGVARFDVAIAEERWKAQGKRDGSREHELAVKERKGRLQALREQVGFAFKLGVAALVEEDAELNGAVDSALLDIGSVPIAAKAGVDMRVVAGILALREAKSEIATRALHFDAGVYDVYNTKNPDFNDYQTNTQALHADASAEGDTVAIAATGHLNAIYPAFLAAKQVAMAEHLPAILKDVSMYNDLFEAVTSSTPQTVFDELGLLAAKPSELSLADWGRKVKAHPGDPPPNVLHYLMVVRHRAAGDSIHFYNTVHSIVVAQLPDGCQAAVMPGLIKPEASIIFKTAFKYASRGWFGRCNDIVRLTIRVETVEGVLMVLKSIHNSKVILVVQQKNRLDPKKDTSAIGGYRDYQLRVAFKRSKESKKKDGGPEYAAGEIQIILASFINVKEGVAAGGGGGHGPYKLAKALKGYSAKTIAYTGSPTKELAERIEQGMLLSITFAPGSEQTVPDIRSVGEAIKMALMASTCKVTTLDFGGRSDKARGLVSQPNAKMMAFVLPIIPNIAGLARLSLAGYDGAELPEALKELTRLQTLDLSNCMFLEQLPDLSHLLPKLQIVGVPKHLSEWERRGFAAYSFVNDETANASKITKLDFSFFGEGLLPAWLGNHCADLHELDLSFSKKLTALPDTLGSCAHLQKLKLWKCCSLQTLPASLSKCTSLQSLNLSECSSLTEPFPDLSHLVPELNVNDNGASAAANAWVKRGCVAEGS